MSSKMTKDIKKILVSKRELKKLTKKLGKQISNDYADKNLLVIGVLKGCFITLADILREITIPCRVELIIAKSYGEGTESCGEVYILNDIDVDFSEYDVLIIEDILDSGRTLCRLLSILSVSNPASLRVCTLLDKPSRREFPVDVDYNGFEIEDEFVVGFGLDYAQKYRNLPYIGIVRFEN